MEVFYSSLKNDLLDFSVILQATSNDASLFLGEASRIYGSIGKDFPILENEIKRENDKAMAVINYFLKSDGDKKNTFDNALKKNQDSFFNALENMQNFMGLDIDLSNSIVDGVAKVDNIMGAIDQIKLLADQIKIYSLNAIVASSKYGVAGRAFGEISKNIIKLSDSSNQEAETMSKVGKQLYSKFSDFKTHIVSVNTKQQSTFEAIKKDIMESFEKVLDTFHNFSKILLDVIERVDGTKSKIFDVMTSLQREDIVRQQTEHIIDSIKIVVDENKKFIDLFNKYNANENKTEEDKLNMEHLLLDLFTFNDVVLTLIMHNFDTIYKEIVDVNNFLKKNLMEMKSLVLDIVTDKDYIIDFFIGDKSSKSFNVLNFVFNNYTSHMQGYISNVSTLLSKKDDIANRNSDISDIIDSLESMFNETKSIAKTFNSINFLAKIELEKNADIFQDSQAFSVQNVESIAANITETVEDCLKEFDIIKADLFFSLEIFKNNIKNQKNEYTTIQRSTENVSKDLDNSKSVIKDNIKTLDGYSNDLIFLIDETLENMLSLDNLLVEINNITGIYKDIVGKMKKRKDTAYKNYDIISWKIENKKFLDIVNKYTIQEERSIADSVLNNRVSDIEIDVGSQSGEFTLF